MPDLDPAWLDLVALALPPVRPARIVVGKPAVVMVEPAGQPGWVMTPEYARQLAALLVGAALAVETLNEWEGSVGDA